LEDPLSQGIVHEESQINLGSRRVLSDVAQRLEAESRGQLARCGVCSYNNNGDAYTVRNGCTISQLQRPLIFFVNIPPKCTDIYSDENEAEQDAQPKLFTPRYICHRSSLWTACFDDLYEIPPGAVSCG